MPRRNLIVLVLATCLLAGPALAQSIAMPPGDFPEPGVFCGPFKLCGPDVTRGG
ncbi:hypothetical protein V8J82_02930 [Gymnodinialimonas sp. 2305UL16-5]|uniref:hypothetical protein n=1 Tax=Gymnodinialimonas mytili TaxID=3126503 RepID=UPI0030A35E8E